MNSAKPVAVFLMAHQDDEFGIFYEIEQAIERGHRVLCFYLTDGSYGKASPAIRNRESCNILSKLGVKKSDIHFLGSDLAIKDTQLCFSLTRAISALATMLDRLPIVSIFCPAWEGGHPDHDALYLVASKLIEQENIQAHQWQYPLYNAAHLIHPLFRVLRNPEGPNEIFSKIIPLKNRLRYLRYCTSYRSQTKSWIGLLPLVAWHYLFDRHQYLHPIIIFRQLSRPHSGPLYYEKRDFITWDEFEGAVMAPDTHVRNDAP